MDKDLLYRFFEGHASVEEMKSIKEWTETSEENSKLLRRERKLFNAIILSGRLKRMERQTTKKKNYFIREFLKIASVVVITVGVTAALFSVGKDKDYANHYRTGRPASEPRFTRWFKRLAECRNPNAISCFIYER